MPRRRKYISPVDEKVIGKRIRALRERRAMSQTELAEKLGINQTLVSQYERGKLRLHGGLVAGMAKVLRVSADDLLGLTKAREDGILKDRRFLRRLQKIEALSRAEKQAVLKTLDLVLKTAQAD